MKQIAHEAMQLTPAQRAELAEVPVESLESTLPDEVQRIWVDEANERLAEVRLGWVETIPGEDVLSEARRLLKR